MLRLPFWWSVDIQLNVDILKEEELQRHRPQSPVITQQGYARWEKPLVAPLESKKGGSAVDADEKKRLKEAAQLEAKYGHLAEEYSDGVEPSDKESMPMQGASLRDIDRIREKRRESKKDK